MFIVITISHFLHLDGLKNTLTDEDKIFRMKILILIYVLNYTHKTCEAM